MDIEINGKQITYDLHKITWKEWRGLFDTSEDAAVSNATLGKTCGMTAEEVDALPYDDYRRLIAGLLKKAREPLADPNSPSASI